MHDDATNDVAIGLTMRVLCVACRAAGWRGSCAVFRYQRNVMGFNVDYCGSQPQTHTVWFRLSMFRLPSRTLSVGFAHIALNNDIEEVHVWWVFWLAMLRAD